MARRRRKRVSPSSRSARFSVAGVGPYFAWLAASGLLLGLSFPRPGLWLLAYVALAPMGVLALRAGSPARLAWTSYVAGVLWWAVMIAWMPRVTVGGYILLCLYCGLYWPLALLSFRALSRGLGFAATLALPLAWVSFELVRGLVPAGGFDWFSLAYSQASWLPEHDAGAVVQVADLFGQYGVSFVVAMSSGVVVDALSRPWIYAAGRRRRISRHLLRPLGAWVIVIVAAHFYGHHRIDQTPDPRLADGLRVAVVQTNVPQDNKINPTDESEARNWRDMLLQINAAAGEQPKPDLIVTPETMAPAALNLEAMDYYTRTPTAERGDDQFGRQLRDLATELDIPLLIGAHAKYEWKQYDDEETGMQYLMPSRRYNAAFLINPDQRGEAQMYSKVHRAPFGEYIPWVEHSKVLKQLFIDYLSPYPFDYTLTQGEALNVLQMDSGARLIAPICYEIVVGRLIREMAYTAGGEKRADVIVNVTNDGWYNPTAEGPQHMQIATLRCIETRLPMARSVNTGISGLVDSAGRVLSIVTDGRRYQDLEGHTTATLAFDPRETLFGMIGQWAVAATAAATGLLVLLGAMRGR